MFAACRACEVARFALLIGRGSIASLITVGPTVHCIGLGKVRGTAAVRGQAAQGACAALSVYWQDALRDRLSAGQLDGFCLVSAERQRSPRRRFGAQHLHARDHLPQRLLACEKLAGGLDGRGTAVELPAPVAIRLRIVGVVDEELFVDVWPLRPRLWRRRLAVPRHCPDAGVKRRTALTQA